MYDEKGNINYEYEPKGNKYWDERDLGLWLNSPKIYEDHCQLFYWFYVFYILFI